MGNASAKKICATFPIPIEGVPTEAFDVEITVVGRHHHHHHRHFKIVTCLLLVVDGFRSILYNFLGRPYGVTGGLIKC